jgi:hypothetical protein
MGGGSLRGFPLARGANAEASRLAGIRVQWIKLVTFAISGSTSILGARRDLADGGRRAVRRDDRQRLTLPGWNPLYKQITLGLILLLPVGGDAWSRLRTT